MKLYFDFFNDKKETKYICLTETNNYLNINLDKFNLTAYLDNSLGIDYSDITDFFLIIEKESNGAYILEKRISGVYSSGVVEYSNCNFDDIVSSNAAYRLYFQFNQGGIIEYNGKDKPYYINLKTKCEDINVDVYDSILIKDYYEIQNIDITLPVVTFKLSVVNNKNFNNYRYYYKFTNSEEPISTDFEYKTLSENEIVIKEGISIASFKNDITYLHVFLKDVFDNVSYKVIKITTKQNTLTLFEILNTEVNITSNEEFSIFYNCRNITSITPMIKISDEQNNTKEEYVSEKTIGMLNKDKNIISFRISDYFEKNFNNQNVKLSFILNNNSNNVSNEMIILIDSVPPVITITNFEDGYKLINTDESIINVLGKIQDDNFFFLGNNKQKIDLKNVKHYLLLHSENNDISKVVFDNGKEAEFLKYSKYYITETFGDSFEVYDKEGQLISDSEYSFINDYCKEDLKNIYIAFDKNKLSQYELNIINTQGGLVVKGSEFLSVIENQYFGELNGIYYIKIEMSKEINKNFEFDVGINDFAYSFLPKINYSNISCNLNNKKEIVTNFTYTDFIVVKSNADLEVTKFTNNRILYKYNTITCGELSFAFVSLSDEEFFSIDTESMYFDDTLNSFSFEEIYSRPKILDKNQNEIECLNYKVTEVNDGVYSFSFNIKIEDGINYNTLQYSDISGNTSNVDFIVEKNTNPISIEIDEYYNKNFNKYNISENEFELTTNKKSVNIKFIIKNETYNNIKNNEAFIIIKSENSYKKQKILTEENQRVVYIEIFNLIENEKENYSVFYNNEVKETILFSILNTSTLSVSSVSNFVSGFNSYFLKYETDNFANVKLQYDNRNFICNLNNNMIEITRANNSKFLEKVEIELIASDKHNLYTPVSKKISGTFYNSSIIQDYSIPTLYNHKVINSQFDLELKTYDAQEIEYIRYYDPLEYDIFKRNKYGTYNSNTQTYTIKNLITPITPSYLDIYIKIKNEDLVINKRLFEEDLISLYEEKNELTVTYVKENDRLHIRLINKEESDLLYRKMEVYNNGNFLEEFEDIEFDKKNSIKDFYLDINNFEGNSEITIKLINRFNKVSFIDTELINFDYLSSTECYLDNFESNNVLKKSDLNNIILVSELKDVSYFLITKEILNSEQRIELKEGSNQITNLSAGQYLFELYYQRNNYIKKVGTYNVEVINDDFEYIDYSREYSKYLKIETIIVRKNINTKFDYLDAHLLHYYNDELIETYEPEINDSYVQFNIKKQYGINRYIYKDKYHQFELDPYIKTFEDDTKSFQIFAVHTDNQSLFYSEKTSSITLDSVENLYFKTINSDEMLIKTNRVRSNIPKTLIDNVENVLFKEFIPCELEFYKNGALIKTINVNLQKDESVPIPFFSEPIKSEEEVNVDKFTFRIRSNGMQYFKSTKNLYIKNKQKHFLLPYAKNIALLSNNISFLSLNIEKQEERIKEMCISYFNQYKNNDVENLKKYIKSNLEEK